MKKVFLFLTTLISLSALTIDASAQIDRGELGSLTTVKDGLRSRRISSADKTGNNGDCVGQFKPGEKWSVEIPGTGVINHIWFTIAPTSIMRNDLIFRIYWDGNKYPSVEAPIAAFFGNGWDEKYEFISLRWQLVQEMVRGLPAISRCLSRRVHVWRLRIRVTSP